MDGITTLKFWYANELIQSFSFAQPPAVPRVGEGIIGEENSYVVTAVAHEYFIPFQQTIHIYLEKT